LSNSLPRADRAYTRGEIHGSTDNRGRLLNLADIEIGVGEPRQVQRLVPCVGIIEICERILKGKHGPHRPMQFGPASAAHDLYFATIYPRRPVGLYLIVASGEDLGRATERALRLARLSSLSMSPGEPFQQERSHR